MNLLPISVASTKGIVESTPGKSPSSTAEGSQDNEFTSIFSDSLAQQDVLVGDVPGESTVAGQQVLASLLPAGGQHLPPEGKSLPPETSTGLTAETDTEAESIDLLSQLTIPLLAQEVVDSSTPVTTATESLTNELSVRAEATSVSGILPANMMTSVVSPENGLQKGITVMNTVSVAEADAALQANVSVSQKPLSSSIQGLLNTQAPQEKSVATASANSENAFSGGTEQRQLSSLPEMSMTKLDEKQDFSTIIEKGLGQLGKEMPTVNAALAPESGSRIVTDSLKTPVETLQLQQHIDKPGWSHEFGNKMTWMTKEGLQSAQIRLTPAHLGTIDVKISIQNDQANISFISQHGAVRDIIEASMPKLRDMLHEAGVRLEHVNVSTNPNAQQQRQHAEHMPEHHQHSHHTVWAEEEGIVSSEIMLSDQGEMLTAVDYFA